MQFSHAFLPVFLCHWFVHWSHGQFILQVQDLLPVHLTNHFKLFLLVTAIAASLNITASATTTPPPLLPLPDNVTSDTEAL
ncbi:hypothetical protein ACFX1S_039729 [Malus domestica]